MNANPKYSVIKPGDGVNWLSPLYKFFELLELLMSSFPKRVMAPLFGLNIKQTTMCLMLR